MELPIPQPWRNALFEVQTICPEAVIGGGCLRDLDNERPIKDIDIFIRGTKAEALKNVRERLIKRGVWINEIDPDKLYPVGDGNDVVGHFEAAFDGIEIPVQIIMVNFDCARICERFDYGICRISYDGNDLTVTDAYMMDKGEHVFRLRRQRTDAEMVASVHRYARLSQKYPGWRFALFEDELGDAF